MITFEFQNETEREKKKLRKRLTIGCCRCCCYWILYERYLSLCESINWRLALRIYTPIKLHNNNRRKAKLISTCILNEWKYYIETRCAHFHGKFNFIFVEFYANRSTCNSVVTIENIEIKMQKLKIYIQAKTKRESVRAERWRQSMQRGGKPPVHDRMQADAMHAGKLHNAQRIDYLLEHASAK